MDELAGRAYSAFDADPQPIVAFLGWLAESHQLPRPPRVLAMGCGPGRLLEQFVAVGWPVVGMEPDPDFHAVACRIPGADARLGGFHELDEQDRYDLITAVNAPFAYLLEHDHRVDALTRCFRALRPGGVLLLDNPNLLYFLRHVHGPVEHESRLDGRPIRLIQHHEYDLDQALFIQHNHYLPHPGDGRAEGLHRTHRHAIVTPPEWRRLLLATGFRELRGYSGYESRKNEPAQGRRLILSARKPL